MTLLPKKGATASNVMHRELGCIDCSFEATAQATTASLLVGSAENGKIVLVPGVFSQFERLNFIHPIAVVLLCTIDILFLSELTRCYIVSGIETTPTVGV